MGDALHSQPEHALSFRYVAFFAGKATREGIWDNRADYIPCLFGQIPSLFEY
jgi:hypothetical protein